MGPETNVCRLCDRSGGKFLSVFEKNEKGHQIVNVIKDCLPIVIYRTDPLSKQICETCNDTLLIVHDFRLTTLSNIEKQKEELESKASEDIKIKLYLDLLNNKDMEEEKCNGIETTLNSSYQNSISMADVSTLTDNSFAFNDTKYDDETNTSDLLSVISTADNNTLNGTNDDTESDMDLEPMETSHNPIIVTRKRRIRGSDYGSPLPKRRKIVGPKSKTTTPQPRFKTMHMVYYNPNSLLKCVLNTINKENLPDYEAEKCVKIEEEIEVEIPYCLYCEAEFENRAELALHETNEHIQLSLERVDLLEYWNDDEMDSFVRNKWLRENFHLQDDEDEVSEEESSVDAEVDEDTEDLLMPMEAGVTIGGDYEVVDTTRNEDIVFVNEQPTINGVPLRDIPKEKRNEFYQSVRLNGVRRKFCNLCRYTFKDNWAIELHYMSRTCYYSCNYCGIKFNKNKPAFAAHVKDHVFAGHPKSDKVFVNRTKNGSNPKELNASCMKPYTPVPRGYRYKPQVEPIRIKNLMEQRRLPPRIIKVEDALERKPYKQMTTADLTDDTQAYFCKKCYQVFCKRDEFNEHSTRCNGEIDDPEMKVIRPYVRKEPYMPIKRQSKGKPMFDQSMDEPEIKGYSSAGRPIRHCVKEVSYSDEKEVEYRASPATPGRFECNFCCSVFPTVHSRNSHMRIHKANFKHAANKTVRPYVQPVERYINPPIKIKQEKPDMYEPIVDIHEGHSSKVSTGSVSITPLNRNNTVNSAIMKLVQNNPNITLKPKNDPKPVVNNLPQIKVERESPPPQRQYEETSQDDGGNRTYKCSSCSKPFANKSNLYFHKKNQCGGSRYPCPFCKKRFGTEAAYSSHIFYSHPV